MNKITFVLPVIRKDYILAKTCVNSIFTLFNNDDIDAFYIITCEHDIDFFKNFFSNYNIQIINQSQLYPHYHIGGWFIQQILKLNIASFIRTDYYIILDADCYLTKKINYTDIIVDNKPIVSLNEKHKNNWLIKSCEYYELDYNNISNEIMDVTPQILNTKIVKELLTTNDNIPHLIIHGGCNEFFLYFCYLLKNYKFDEIYYVDINKQLSNNGIWIMEHIKNDSIKFTIGSQFDDESTIFSLFQSNLNISPELYVPIINENIIAKNI